MSVDVLPSDPPTTPNFFRLSPPPPPIVPARSSTQPQTQTSPTPSNSHSTSLFWSFVRANAGKIAAVSLLALGLAGVIGITIATAFVLNPTVLLVLFGLLIASTIATGVGLALTICFFGGKEGARALDLGLTPLSFLAFM